GLAAGFDKNGTVAEGLAALGFGFIEVGTVTHLAQPGNPRPRLFRLPLDRALINRQGFNNRGAAALAAHLALHRPACPLGINIGKSRAVPMEEAIDDYLSSLELVHEQADYIVVNVSSPNTPNLRELQRPDKLSALLSALQGRNLQLAQKSGRKGPLPMLVKVAPDLEMSELETIVGVSEDAGLAGIIATNTTTSRQGLKTPAELVAACGDGGLSGAPLSARSTRMIGAIHRLTKGRMVIIGVGGIFNAADAWEKICAGASLLQLYTGFIYEGARIVRSINEGLREMMAREGVGSIDEAVGSRAASVS
ncbi:MAG TPA: quinone-dependent dihydroorotate dehydrogenase, partial [Pyrinomonadaceae bacterium]